MVGSENSHASLQVRQFLTKSI